MAERDDPQGEEPGAPPAPRDDTNTESLRVPAPEEREAYLRQADYNLFSLQSDDVLIDL